jgi:hypothetical protein
MSDICSAINDDTKEYVNLCEHFGEEVQYDEWFAHGRVHRSPACYGAHADKLKAKRNAQSR